MFARSDLRDDVMCEKCYQLAQVNKKLREENIELLSELDSANETIKDKSEELVIMLQKLHSLSKIAQERDKLVECLEDEKTSKRDLQLSLEEEKSLNVQLKAHLAMAEEKGNMLNAKVLKLDKQLQEKGEAFSKAVQIIREYEVFLQQKLTQCSQISQEVVSLKVEVLELQKKLKNATDEDIVLQFSNSDTEHNGLHSTPLLNHNRLESPQNWRNFEYSVLKSPVFQSFYGPPLIRTWPVAESIRLKSLAQEIYEAGIANRVIQTTSCVHNVKKFDKSVQCRKGFSFGGENENEYQKDLMLKNSSNSLIRTRSEPVVNNSVGSTKNYRQEKHKVIKQAVEVDNNEDVNQGSNIFLHTNATAKLKNLWPSQCWLVVTDLMNNTRAKHYLRMTLMDDLTIVSFIFLYSLIFFFFTILYVSTHKLNLSPVIPVQNSTALNFNLCAKYLLQRASKLFCKIPGEIFNLQQPLGPPPS
ncbi:unnamed protein product [Trichobilharzia szidati]|nr:unnamed protein product [Trichobilharzia szidati]